MKELVNNNDLVRVLDGEWSPLSVIEDIIAPGQQEDPFYIFDVGDVIAKYKQWKRLLPRVDPFYAVKCNDSELVLRVLAALGTGFDCASKVEINKVMDLSVPSERIIFANPAKPASHIRHAASLSVDKMTFDSESELMKIKQLYPTARLVIRIRSDAADVQCNLGIKFGCNATTEAPRLLKIAASLGLNVIGVSFHVGSGCRETAAYDRAIAAARKIFDEGAKLGFAMHLLDLGGGYPGDIGTSIDALSTVINEALSFHFPDPSVQVIAEPGRYFVSSAYTLVCNIHSMRQILNEDNEVEHTMFFINDGVYGSFNCMLYDHQEVEAEPLKTNTAKRVQCSIWGPTCDGLDRVAEHALLPADVAAGDWLLFRNMGAYTLPVASPFNGFPVPEVHAVVAGDAWIALQPDLPPSSREVNAGDARRAACAPPVVADTFALYVECGLK